SLFNGISIEPGDGAEAAHPPTYYPGTDDKSKAIPVVLKAGEERRAEFTLSAVQKNAITGKVLTASSAVKGVFVLLRPRELEGIFSPLAFSGTTNAEGAFELKSVQNGLYTLSAISEKDRSSAKQHVMV